MKVSVGVSARHVHLTKEDFIKLFGYDNLTKLRDISQPGLFAAEETVTIKGSKGQFNNVRILGPFREYSQVEVSKTDSYTLGVIPPVRTSGDLDGAEKITVIGPKGEITKDICIIADRHIHIRKDEADKQGIKDKQKAFIKIEGEKRGIIEVSYKVSEHATFELHLDLDDANAFLIKQGDILEIIEK